MDCSAEFTEAQGLAMCGRNVPQNIIIHHTAVSYDKNPDQVTATNSYHKSKGWGMIGYHYEIAKNGTLHRGRKEHWGGAHCYQNNMNFRSIGIVMDGQFDTELPTKEQEATLRGLIIEIMARYKIPEERIFNHRHFAPKTCPGSKLPDNYGRTLLDDVPKEFIPLPWAREAYLWHVENKLIEPVTIGPNGEKVYNTYSEDLQRNMVIRHKYHLKFHS